MVDAIDHRGKAPRALEASADIGVLAEATAVQARTAGIGAQFASVLDERDGGFDDLGRHARDATREPGRVEPVLRRAGAHAAALEDAERERCGIFRGPVPDADPDRIGAAGDHPLREHLSEGAEDHPGQEVADDVPRRHRRRFDAVEDRTLRRGHMHRQECAVVVRHVRADRGLDREARVGVGVVEDDVDPPPRLRRRSGKVDVDVLVADGHRGADADRLIVAVGPRLGGPRAVREVADGVAHGAFRAVDDGVAEILDVGHVEFVEEGHQRFRADDIGGHLRVEVADGLARGAHVGPDHLQEKLIGLPRRHQLADGDAQPLLVHLTRLAGEQAAADVRGMAGGGEIRDRASASEDGGDHRHVVDLPRGEPRVVGEQDVAVLERRRGVGGEQVLDAGGHRIDVARGAGQRLRHHAAAPVEDTAGEILRVADDGAEGGAHQRDLLLVDDGEQAVPEDFENDRVNGRHHSTPDSRSVTTKFQLASTEQRAPGPTITVDSRSSTMAGPGKLAPGPRR